MTTFQIATHTATTTRDTWLDTRDALAGLLLQDLTNRCDDTDEHRVLEALATVPYPESDGTLDALQEYADDLAEAAAEAIGYRTSWCEGKWHTTRAAQRAGLYCQISVRL